MFIKYLLISSVTFVGRTVTSQTIAAGFTLAVLFDDCLGVV